MINAEYRVAEQALRRQRLHADQRPDEHRALGLDGPRPVGQPQDRRTPPCAPPIGKKVNTLVVNDQVWEYLRGMTAIKNAIYGERAAGRADDTSRSPAVLGLKRIIVGSASYWNGSAFVDIWGKSALWAYYPDSVDENRGRIIVPDAHRRLERRRRRPLPGLAALGGPRPPQLGPLRRRLHGREGRLRRRRLPVHHGHQLTMTHARGPGLKPARPPSL